MKKIKYKGLALLLAISCLTTGFMSNAQEVSSTSGVVDKTAVNNITLKKMFFDGTKVKKWFHNGEKVYADGNTVTYYFDSNDVYVENIENETSCLDPQEIDYENRKKGWEFVGWREDDAVSTEVLSEKIMNDEPITLYAVYKRTLTASFDGNGATSGFVDDVTGVQYYNNGNSIDPKVTLPENGYTYTDHIFVDWSAGDPGSEITLTDNITITANWKERIYFIQNTVRNKNTMNAFGGGSAQYVSVYYTDSNSCFRMPSTYALNGQSYIYSPSVVISNSARFDIKNRSTLYIDTNSIQVKYKNSTGYYLCGFYVDIMSSTGKQLKRVDIYDAGADVWTKHHYTIDLTGLNEENCYFRVSYSAVTSGNTNYYQITNLYME